MADASAHYAQRETELGESTMREVEPQVIEPRIRGFISLTAHPEGCAGNVRAQVETIRAAGPTVRTDLNKPVTPPQR